MCKLFPLLRLLLLIPNITPGLLHGSKVITWFLWEVYVLILEVESNGCKQQNKVVTIGAFDTGGSSGLWLVGIFRAW